MKRWLALGIFVLVPTVASAAMQDGVVLGTFPAGMEGTGVEGASDVYKGPVVLDDKTPVLFDGKFVCIDIWKESRLFGTAPTIAPISRNGIVSIYCAK